MYIREFKQYTGHRQSVSSPAIPQPRRHSIDRQMYHPPHTLVACAAAVPLQHFDLQMVERIKVGEAIANRALEHGVARGGHPASMRGRVVNA